MPIIFNNVTISGAILVAAASSPTPSSVAISLSSPDSDDVTVNPSGNNIINNIAWYTFLLTYPGFEGTNEIELRPNMVAGFYDTSGNLLGQVTQSNFINFPFGLLYIGIATGPVTWGLTNWTTTGGTVPVSPNNIFRLRQN
jgi:hypothetical protein